MKTYNLNEKIVFSPEKAISHPPKSYLNNIAKSVQSGCSCGGKCK